MSPEAASAEGANLERLLADLSRLRLEPHRVSMGYRFGLAFVALAMLLLPLAYFALVGLFCWWLLLQLGNPPGAEHPWALVGYVLLAVAGPITLLFMVKPWFGRRSGETVACPLMRGEAPDLECFVGLLARAVGAPGPRRIELDCSVNASAGFRGGFRGMLGEELKLTIGLPLVAGLDMRSFVGVLAHELGHFSQRAGMRLAWFIMRLNVRFTDLVERRDRWDRFLQEASRSDRAAVQLFALASLSLVWLARQPLRVLMGSARAISSFALRQMEFDADGYEVVLAGSETFRSTTRNINLLSAGSLKALDLIGETLPEGRLPNNLPMLARAQTDALSSGVCAAVERDMMAQSTRSGLFRAGRPGSALSFFPTHPCDRERIDKAEDFNAPGLIHSRMPATCLFKDFSASSERVTAGFYPLHFDLDVSACQLADHDTFCGTVALRERRFSACESFFDGRFTVARPLLFGSEEWQTLRAGRSSLPLAESLRSNRHEMLALLNERAHAFEGFEQAEAELVQIERAIELFQAGFRIRPKAFGLPRNPSALSDRQSDAAARRDRALVELAAFERSARQRISGAVAWHLGCDRATSRAERLQTRRVLRSFRALQVVFPKLRRLRRRVLAQRALLQNLSPAMVSRSVVERLQANSAELSELGSACREAMRAVPYPFEHAAKKISVADYASATFAEGQLVLRSYRTAEALIERLFDLYFRSLGHLCEVTEISERRAAKSL